MNMDLENLMQRIASEGVTVLLKADHERYAERGEYWTIVLSGDGLGETTFVRAEEATLTDCLSVVLSRLLKLGERWDWVLDFLPRENGADGKQSES